VTGGVQCNNCRRLQPNVQRYRGRGWLYAGAMVGEGLRGSKGRGGGNGDEASSSEIEKC